MLEIVGFEMLSANLSIFSYLFTAFIYGVQLPNNVPPVIKRSPALFCTSDLNPAISKSSHTLLRAKNEVHSSISNMRFTRQRAYIIMGTAAVLLPHNDISFRL